LGGTKSYRCEKGHRGHSSAAKPLPAHTGATSRGRSGGTGPETPERVSVPRWIFFENHTDRIRIHSHRGFGRTDEVSTSYRFQTKKDFWFQGTSLANWKQLGGGFLEGKAASFQVNEPDSPISTIPRLRHSGLHDKQLGTLWEPASQNPLQAIPGIETVAFVPDI
jgi:hypothetical protein